VLYAAGSSYTHRRRRQRRRRRRWRIIIIITIICNTSNCDHSVFLEISQANSRRGGAHAVVYNIILSATNRASSTPRFEQGRVRNVRENIGKPLWSRFGNFFVRRNHPHCWNFVLLRTAIFSCVTICYYTYSDSPIMVTFSLFP